ncbi:MAG: glycosyltransferase [Flavobacteriaceae bacterium]|uniref:DUF2062 domain-containing protein n=1 Tax=Leeuwenhoekiella sp. UBA1003 TaxID=1946744 RepID=UPI000C8D1260|nr:DUF2062 domain-containing protein [Leeuwenhoekiella sp. UBA1003]MAT90035.1 glycosyltransferase [Flavobacteriaceae bacterium]
MDTTQVHKAMKDLRCCVVIPTYNNERTLARVINGVLQYTTNVIVVNDGATDDTEAILSAIPQLTVVRYANNQGKGFALRQGFQQALEMGYDHAITIDSDGQHFPEDIPVFLQALMEAKDDEELLLIGARNMKQEGVPGKSSFGNKFSNFWFWVETGIKLQDTQSGYRLYPIRQLQKKRFYTKKFEFEIEVIVKAAWMGITVKNVPVRVLYDAKERVSHFRPFKDFTRISILNTWLVFWAFVYIKPVQLFKRYREKGLKRFLIEDFLQNNDSPKIKALSMALGVFVGISPFWGFHTYLVIFLAVTFKLNRIIAFAFSNVSIPPFIPFVVLASIKVGHFVLGLDYSYSLSEISENFEVFRHLKSYLIGSFILASVSAIATGLVGYLVLSIFKTKMVPTNE